MTRNLPDVLHLFERIERKRLTKLVLGGARRASSYMDSYTHANADAVTSSYRPSLHRSIAQGMNCSSRLAMFPASGSKARAN